MKRLAAIGLVLGPLLFLFDALIDPAWAEDNAAYLEEVARNEFRYVTAEVSSTIGALFLIAAMLGVTGLMHEQRSTLGQLAAWIVMVGFVGLTGSVAFSALDLAMADFGDRAAMIELRGELEDSAPYRAYWLVFSGIATVGGLILLAVALYRRRVVPSLSPVAIFIAAALWYVGGDEQAVYAASWVFLAAALAPLATRVRSLT